MSRRSRHAWRNSIMYSLKQRSIAQWIALKVVKSSSYVEQKSSDLPSVQSELFYDNLKYDVTIASKLAEILKIISHSVLEKPIIR
ncbi:hypothetical protein GCM10008022_29340 [Paenibacillus hunanensis]|nr:hypothetical protein GCM10008022_29340 [Paenibacillus hunanensis]